MHYHRNQDAAEALAAELGGVALQADLRDEAQADALVPRGRRGARAPRRLRGQRRRVAERRTSRCRGCALERWRATIDANLTATFLTARGYLRHVEGAGEGALVLVASTAGLFGEAGHADYAAAKAAIAHGLALSLKNEVVRTAPRARVNVVAPGWTVSPMTAADLTPRARRPRHRDDGAAQDRRDRRRRERGRLAVLPDRAPATSPGQVITVAGGMEGRLLHEPPTRPRQRRAARWQAPVRDDGIAGTGARCRRLRPPGRVVDFPAHSYRPG